MKWIASLLLLFAASVHAQDCVNNVDSAGNVCTAFTLGGSTANCIPVLTQDGQAVAQFSGAVCPLGFFGGGGMQIQLPRDPANPGNALVSYLCSTALVSNTAPGFSKTPLPPGSIVESLSCDVNYGYVTATWVGTLTFNYSSVHQTRCSGGRGGGCRTGYYPIETSAGGEIATPPLPPPPPPPPPQPIVISVSVLASACDANLDCALVPGDPTVIASALFAINASTLQVFNADGTVDFYSLDFVNVAAANEDGTLYTVSAEGSLYAANGILVKSVSVVVTVAVDEDTGVASVTGGTLEVTIPVV